MTYYKKCLIKQQNEYNVGDFVQVERKISLKPNTLNYYKYNGIIVEKIQKSIEERTIYWFKDDYNYLVSVPAFKGDYLWIAEKNIKGKLNLPVEYKLSMVGQFGDWWHTKHKSVYHCLLIEVIK